MQARLPNAHSFFQASVPTSVDRILATQFWRPGPSSESAKGSLAKVIPFVPRALSPLAPATPARTTGPTGKAEKAPKRRF